MANTNIYWNQLSDAVIVRQIGQFIRHTRQQQQKTQAQLAETAGLNRWTIHQVEKGESVTLSSLIQVLRALDSLHVLNNFEVTDEISPIEYAKLKKKQQQRVRSSSAVSEPKEDLGW